MHLSSLFLLILRIADLEDAYDEDEADYEIEDSDEERWPTNTHKVAFMIRHCFLDILILFYKHVQKINSIINLSVGHLLNPTRGLSKHHLKGFQRVQPLLFNLVLVQILMHLRGTGRR